MLSRVLSILLLASTAFAQDFRPVETLEPIVQKHFPDARFHVNEGTYEVKHGTMLFQVHNISKTGDISQTVYQEEGPNFRGFLLRIRRENGPYAGAAAAPQTMSRPYWTTYFDAVPTADGTGHWHINFSFGGRVDPDFKKAVLGALPKHAGAPR